MAFNKTHKQKKVKRMRGRNMGTHGSGARKNKRGSGNRGGIGMAGTGKRADHRKTYVQKKYNHGYFGKKGVTSLGSKRDTENRINLQTISLNLESFGKKNGDKWEIDAKNYKILGKGEVKGKLVINAKSASKTAIEKVSKAGGEIILKEKNKGYEKKNVNKESKEEEKVIVEKK